jgi:hypothetical protein
MDLRQDHSMASTAAATQGGLTFVRAPQSGLDRLLPARTGPFLAVVLGIAALFWAAGFALAGDRTKFLQQPEWWVGPLYLAVHLALLRLFVSAYAGNFAAGCKAVEVDPAEVRRRLRTVLGVLGVLGACVVTAPLVVIDVHYLRGEYLADDLALGPGGTLGPADWLLVVAWTVEWVINTYLWVVIVGLLVQTLHVLRRHDFRDPIERVLRQRQYRPFLLMSAQGASLTLVLAAATIGYIAIAGGVTSDYIGLWVTGGLVMLGFVPPWLTLKARLGRLVEAEARTLGETLDASTAGLGSGERNPATSVEALGARLDFVLDLVRVDHLTRLHKELGKSEAQATLLRLLVPAATGGWRFLRLFLGL